MILKFLSLFMCFFVARVSGEEFELIKGRNRRSISNLTLHSQLSFDEDQKIFILNQHNTYRRDAGSSNMLLMSWDQELANTAQEHSEKCVFEHSDNDLGENLFIGSGSFSSLAQTFVTSWHNEISDYNYDDNLCAPMKVCGHYTQIVWASTYLVGCGVATCRGVEDGVEYSYMTCNYRPPGNIHNNDGLLRPFQRGSPCSACDSTDTCDNELCANPSRNVLATTSTASTSSSTSIPVTTSSPTTPTSSSATTLLPTTTTTTTTATSTSTSTHVTSTSTLSTTTPTSISTSTDSPTTSASTTSTTTTTSTSPSTISLPTPTITTTPSSSTHSTTTRTESTSTPLSSTSTSGAGTSTSFSSTSAPAEECQYQQEYRQILSDYRETLQEWKEANEC